MDIKEELNKPVIRAAVALLIGVAIGAIFYPTKHIEERERQRYEIELNHVKEEHTKETQQLQETFAKEKQETSHTIQSYEGKITKLTNEIHILKSKTKTAYYKVVRPDGTVEIKKFSESEVNESTQVISKIQEEFKQKIDSIEEKWEKVHKQRLTEIVKQFDSKEQEYTKKIAELEKSKISDVNKKQFGLEAGVTTNLNYYGHATADLFGPVFVGAHAQFGSSSSAGLGLGLRF